MSTVWGHEDRFSHSLQNNKHRGGSASSAGCPGKNRGEILAEKISISIRLSLWWWYTAISCDITAHIMFSVKKQTKKRTMLDYWAVFELMTLRLLHRNADLLSITEKPSGCACLRHYLFVHSLYNRMSTRRRPVFVYVPVCSDDMSLHRQRERRGLDTSCSRKH